MNVRTHSRTAIVAFVVVSSLAPARPSLAQAADPAAAASSRSSEASDHFHRGVVLYKDADYEAALIEFRRAQELAPHYRILYNIGQACYQLQRYADALTALESYLAQGGSQISHARRAAVEADLRVLHTRVGRVEVTVSLDGAEVRVDEQVVGTSPLPAPVLVSIGHRKLTVAKAGFVPLEKYVDVAAGDRTKIVFEFPTPQSPPPPVVVQAPAPAPRPVTKAVSPSSVPPSSPPQSRSLAWIPWVITGTLGAGTAVTGALALNAKSSFDNELATFSGDSKGIEDARSRAKTFALASDVLLGATAVSLGVALYVTLVHGGSSRERTGPDVAFGFGFGGAQLRGTY
jgi:hypothetical protein